MTDYTTDRILYALYCLSRDSCVIDASSLARVVDVTPTQAATALIALERAGLVDATRARLTMLGLARAAALSARGGGGTAIDLTLAKPRAKPEAAGLAALPSAATPHGGGSESKAPSAAADPSKPLRWLTAPAAREH